MSASSILKLQKVGFSAEQVEALADFMDTQVAGKADLFEVRSALKADLAETKAELKADLAETEHRLDKKITEIKSELKLLEQRMTIKLGAMLLATAGLIVAALRYLPPGH